MKKNKILTILLIILVYLFSITLYSYVKYMEELDKISTGYSSSSTAKKINTDVFLGEKREHNLKFLFSYTEIDNYIMFDDSFNNNQIRGVLVKGKVGSPKILSGRFFNESDFFSEKKIVVIGENMVQHTYEENEKKYISLFDNAYEVIGICGYGLNSIMDNIIFYNLDSVYFSEWGIYSDGRIKNVELKRDMSLNLI
ncbi:ABC transporter permease [Alkaliphilus oremlandii]|uniref:MacB-like periplasmic core domain-containing protein n=1 Tax=Alkaliphilus oremlandii (strain OhILAs) TaxID=350688 RepID=A8MIY7_ALKOO|nr:ABC transporter permease [Alkaliphilus oremlandii]ABW19769.1 conserved hypothetical protein [Alkaliphilus oremlandii OhILAs]